MGISIHTGNALRGYEVDRIARERGAWVVCEGIHATLYPDEPFAAVHIPLSMVMAQSDCGVMECVSLLPREHVRCPYR